MVIGERDIHHRTDFDLVADRVGMTFVERHPFPAPGVRADEHAERVALEDRQKRELDGADGHMPIEAAMRAIAAKGPRAFDPI